MTSMPKSYGRPVDRPELTIYLAAPRGFCAGVDRAIQIDPNQALYFYWRGNGFAWKGDDDKAIADYDQAIKLDPVTKFLKEMGLDNAPTQETLKVARSGLPEETQVVLLDLKSKEE